MSQEQAPNQKIADKIQKLLKLAAGNTTEAEASSAMEKVQQLLADYNLTMADIESRGEATQDGKREKSVHEKSAMYAYQRNLMKACAEAFFCIYFTSQKSKWTGKRWTRKAVHVVMGREANVTSVRLMFDYLNNTIDKLANVEYPPPTNLSRPALSWKEGCAYRLQERLRERTEEANEKQRKRAEEARQNASPSNCTAVMLLTDVRQQESDLNHDFIYDKTPGTTALQRAQRLARPAEPEPEISEAERAKRIKDWEKWEKQQEKKNEQYWKNKDMDAFWAGHEKGETIGLDPQCGHSPVGRIS